MTNIRPSLLERAAEIYDFSSGLPVGRAPADLPPPRPRRLEPVEAPPAPRVAAVETPRPQPAAKSQPAPKPAYRSVQHSRAEVDRDALARHGLIAPEGPANGLAEEMRLIKRRLLAKLDERALQGDERARIVLVASGQPGEGKTFMAANLALSIAGEQDRSVLLIDGDSAKAELLERFGLENERGFVDTLKDSALDAESLVIETDVERLFVLPAGAKERNVPELLASARTEQVLDRLLAADPRRIVIIDSPPALAASAATALAAHAGQALVVVRADRTSESDLTETVDLLSACDHVSLVLNSAAFQVRRRRYSEYEDHR